MYNTVTVFVSVIFLIKFLFNYIKMSKIHQLNIIKIIKKDLKKSLWKVSKSFQRRKRKKQQYGSERCKNVPEYESKGWLSKKENIIKWEKTPYYNYKKLFSFRKLEFFGRAQG